MEALVSPAIFHSESLSSSIPRYFVPKPRGPRPALAAGATRHSTFYFQDELSVFQVEDQLYRVHRYFLQKNSAMFQVMFSYRQSSGEGTAEGSSDSKPIILDGTTRLEFESLLLFFYESMHADFSMTPEQWLALLAISERFAFDDVRKRAVDHIFTMRPRLDPIERISIAERLHLPREKYLFPAAMEVVARSKPLRATEIERLSSNTVARIAKAREDFLFAALRAGGPSASDRNARYPKQILAPDQFRRIAAAAVAYAFAEK